MKSEISPEYVFLDTGSPHHVQVETDLTHLDVKSVGRAIRYSDLYKTQEAISILSNNFRATPCHRTYERGVEDETLSCGTGATAVAIAMNATGKTFQSPSHRGRRREITSFL
jgi:diaminopimelate epimerase